MEEKIEKRQENNEVLCARVDLLVNGNAICAHWSPVLADLDIMNPTISQIEDAVNLLDDDAEEGSELWLYMPDAISSINGKQFLIKLVPDDLGRMQPMVYTANRLCGCDIEENDGSSHILCQDAQVLGIRFFSYTDGGPVEYVWQQGAFVQVGIYKDNALFYEI